MGVFRKELRNTDGSRVGAMDLIKIIQKNQVKINELNPGYYAERDINLAKSGQKNTSGNRPIAKQANDLKGLRKTLRPPNAVVKHSVRLP